MDFEDDDNYVIIPSLDELIERAMKYEWNYK